MHSSHAASRGELCKESIRHKSGDLRYFSENGRPVYGPDGKPLFIEGVIFDVTERKKAEEKIKTSLKEKEILLKEVHHRVKNNLQIVSSLLNLQSRHITDKKMLEVLRDVRNRVSAMSLVHENLYKSENFSKIDVYNHVKSMTNQLFQTYNVNPSIVTLKTHIEDIYLGVDVAILCGLIISELISNALKYAFPGGRHGELAINIHQEKDSAIVVQISDNGVGIAPGVNFEEPAAFGLWLVKILAEQLHARLTLQNDGGTTVKLKFKPTSEQQNPVA